MKLKPCPFCGAVGVKENNWGLSFVNCSNERCPLWATKRAMPEKEWNTRAIPEPTNCIWTYKDDPDYPYWASACGLDWCSTEGTPADNSMYYCPNCGGKLVNAERIKAQEEA